MTRSAPIPEQATPDTPRLRALPIEDNGEALIPASLAPERMLVRPRYHLEGLPGALAECFVREGVLTRLLAASEALPAGYRLVLFDGWRPVSLQRWLYDRCADEFDQAGERDRVEDFVSRPMPDETVSPPYHLTGGAVDLSIADDRGRLLAMGTGFDAMVEASQTRHFEDADPSNETAIAIRDNRRLLYHVMIDAGFVNLPSEWWHYDYGDQLWAWTLDKPAAIYGAAEPEFRWGELP
jgi:D-alanyl-D-alanine dipeptidase